MMLRVSTQTLEQTIYEREVEEVFVTMTNLLSEALGFDFELRLVARQMPLPSGRLDLLLMGKTDLYLVELKVTPFEAEFIHQIDAYRRDLQELQKNGALAIAALHPIILVPAAREDDESLCASNSVILKTYSPETVLRAFYARMAGRSGFLTVKPKDYGVWNLHLIYRALARLQLDPSIRAISESIGLKTGTVRNYLLFAAQLGLVERMGRFYLLTELGFRFMEAKDPILAEWTVSPQQTALIREQILKNPFASPTVFGIFAVVESVFILSRNSYPVEMPELIRFFTEYSGKRTEWRTQRAAFVACSEFVHFASSLGLLATAADKVMLTPSGYRFTLLLQLHKGIQMVDAVQAG